MEASLYWFPEQLTAPLALLFVALPDVVWDDADGFLTKLCDERISMRRLERVLINGAIEVMKAGVTHGGRYVKIGDYKLNLMNLGEYLRPPHCVTKDTGPSCDVAGRIAR